MLSGTKTEERKDNLYLSLTPPSPPNPHPIITWTLQPSLCSNRSWSKTSSSSLLLTDPQARHRREYDWGQEAWTLQHHWAPGMRAACTPADCSPDQPRRDGLDEHKEIGTHCPRLPALSSFSLLTPRPLGKHVYSQIL